MTGGYLQSFDKENALDSSLGQEIFGILKVLFRSLPLWLGVTALAIIIYVMDKFLGGWIYLL
jgi:hypothetical protein